MDLFATAVLTTAASAKAFFQHQTPAAVPSTEISAEVVSTKAVPFTNQEKEENQEEAFIKEYLKATRNGAR
jgi:hypothetical protein